MASYWATSSSCAEHNTGFSFLNVHMGSWKSLGSWGSSGRLGKGALIASYYNTTICSHLVLVAHGGLSGGLCACLPIIVWVQVSGNGTRPSRPVAMAIMEKQVSQRTESSTDIDQSLHPLYKSMIYKQYIYIYVIQWQLMQTLPSQCELGHIQCQAWYTFWQLNRVSPMGSLYTKYC